jgi:hypothetical protein
MESVTSSLPDASKDTSASRAGVGATLAAVPSSPAPEVRAGSLSLACAVRRTRHRHILKVSQLT